VNRDGSSERQVFHANVLVVIATAYRYLESHEPFGLEAEISVGTFSTTCSAVFRHRALHNFEHGMRILHDGQSVFKCDITFWPLQQNWPITEHVGYLVLHCIWSQVARLALLAKPGLAPAKGVLTAIFKEQLSTVSFPFVAIPDEVTKILRKRERYIGPDTIDMYSSGCDLSVYEVVSRTLRFCLLPGRMSAADLP